MGYSAFIIAKDGHLQKKMFSFLEEHMESYNKHFHDKDECHFGLRVGSKGNNGISYTGGRKDPLIIGFDFNSGGGERQHMFAILEWMSNIIGNKPGKFYYDGELLKFSNSVEVESKRIFRDKKKEDKRTIEDIKRNVSMFLLSMWPDKGETNAEMDAKIKNINDFINNDIKRLDQLWKQ